jgi:hypothetical protein
MQLTSLCLDLFGADGVYTHRYFDYARVTCHPLCPFCTAQQCRPLAHPLVLDSVRV